MLTGYRRARLLCSPIQTAFKQHLLTRDCRFLCREQDLHDVTSPLTVRGRLYVLLNRFDKRFPLVLELSWRIVKRHIFPFVVLSNLDEFFAVLAEPQRSVGADNVALITRCAVRIAYRYCNARQSILVSNERRGGIIARLLVRPRSDRCGYGNRLRRHHPCEAVDDVNAVR